MAADGAGDGEPVRVGLAGAGAWAARAHAPNLAAGPATSLAGVWSRRAGPAAELAGRFGVPAFASFEALLDGCDAVALAVPPDVQPALAVRAARAGRAVLLDKPLAADVAGARRVVDAVGEAGVASQMVLTLRYAAGVRAFLDRARAVGPFGATGAWVSGGTRGGAYATAWRRDLGPLLDVGPHLVDLLEAALGSVVAVRSHGARRRWAGLLLDHEDGAVSEASLCTTAPVDEPTIRVDVYGDAATASMDRSATGPDIWPTLLAEFAGTVRTGAPHPLDAAHGLHLQRLLDQAARALAAP